jgi:outer membrane protein assembly factor BamB
VLITVVCPGCQTEYHLGEVLVGKEIRCPNNDCRTRFKVARPVRGSAPPAAGTERSPGTGKQQSGSVNDFVPVLPAESAGPGRAAPSSDSLHVSDFVPLAEAEAAPADPAPVEMSWERPPPVRGGRPQTPPPEPPPSRPAPMRNGPLMPAPASRPPQAPPQATVPTRTSLPTPADDGTKAPPASPPAAPRAAGRPKTGVWQAEAPPVRLDSDEPAAEAVPDAPAVDDSVPYVTADAALVAAARRRKRRNVLLIGAMVVFLVLAGVGGYAIFQSIVRNSEDYRAKDAYKAFTDLRYANAKEDFKDLQGRFGKTSARLDEYHSMEDLSGVLAGVTGVSSSEEAAAALELLSSFAEGHKSDPFVKEHAVAVGKATAKLASGLIEAEKNGPSDATPDRLAKLEGVLEGVGGLGENVFDRGAREKWRAEIAEAREAHRRWAHRRDARQRVLALLTNGELHPVDALKAVRELLKQYEHHPELQGIGDEPDVKAAFEAAYKRHFDSVVFEPVGVESEKPADAGIPFPSLIFDPHLPQNSGPAARAPPGDPVVLSLVRGVLYAHALSTGEVRWVVRVGVDTTTLPVRVPATASSPERILVLLADSETLSAFDPDGNEVWRYRLGSPCLGRPLVVEPSVFLPTYDGQVHEVDLSGGKLVGRWQLGQHLSGGGAREGRSKVVYFPADSTCVYALNVDPKERRCAAILYSNHPAGSLRGEPMVVAPGQKDIAGSVAALPGFLILNQTDGLDSTRLRAFPLPLAERSGPEIQLNPVPRLAGWTWFTPSHDGERIAAVTDAGVFALFGIDQPGNRDAALFPMLPPLNLHEAQQLVSAAPGRSQVVYARDDDYWVLSGGRLQCWGKAWNAAVGPRLIPRWREALELGSPLHASQVEEDRATGRNTLVVVTQSLQKQVCLVTAVRDEDGKKLWQRQVGLVCQGAPVLLAPPAPRPDAGAPAGPAPQPVVVALGQSGELFTLDPVPFARQQSRWLSGEKSLLLGPLEASTARPPIPPVLLPGADGLSAYEAAFPGAGDRVVVRRIILDPATRQASAEEKEYRLPIGASPAGAPALVGNALLLPLTDGILFRVQVSPLATKGEGTANWRSPRVGAEARGYVAALGPDTFVATDGAKGLSCWKIDEQGRFWGLPADKPDDEAHALELDDRVASAPLVLTRQDGTPNLYAADAGGLLRSIKVASTYALKEAANRWDLGGRVVTAGPFLRTPPESGPRIGCVVDGKRLVWIDPRKGTSPLWVYETAGAAIVGEPQLVGGKLIVADQGGRIAALDPETGPHPEDKSYALPGSVAPAAPPVAFDNENLFTPLTDGTALLVPMRLFR